jgi:hypothetical protein
METNKLYRVELKGLSSSTGVCMHSSYVIATDPASAYNKVRKWLDEKDYGFKHDRELSSIHLIAEDHEYTGVRTRLFI